jgi:two-component system sensor histidine kinase KdpD
MAVGVVAIVTLAAFVFTPLVGAHATALVFLLAVVLVALVIERGPTLLAATLSALSWDFFFLPPVFAFRIEHFEDAMLFSMYFVVALVLGQFTARNRAQQEAERLREARATALYLLTRELNHASNLDQLVRLVVRQMEDTFDAQVAVFLPDAKGKLAAHSAGSFRATAQDERVIAWVLEHRQSAGRFTENLAEADALYVPLASADSPVAVMGLRLRQNLGLSIHQQSLLDAFSHQIALALDRQRLNEISETARLLAESERLSKTLFDSMSHEIRTPIAVIKSAAGNLAELPEGPLSSLQQKMLTEIEEATERLNRLVGNVLEVSRIESGNVRPRLNECDVTELVHIAVAETEKELSGHQLTVRLPPVLPMVRMDFVLMQQVLTNLISNATFHTPPGTAIELTARIDGQTLVLEVADNGPGIPTESLGRVFDKFYRAPNAPTGGTGLGLSLVRGFVEAHGGSVKVENRAGSGAAFIVSLPIGTPTVPSGMAK